MKFLLLILKNLRRGRARTAITVLAVMLLVATFCMVATVVSFLDTFTTERGTDVRTILSDRYRIPSRFDRGLMDQIVRPYGTVNARLRQIPGFHPERYTVWHFIIFSLDPEMKNKDLSFFAIATLPESVPVMMEDLESFDPAVCQQMVQPPRSRKPNIGLLMGPDRLRKLGKQVGDVFVVRSISHKDGSAARLPIEMEFEIVGALPAGGRWSNAAIMDYAYLDRVLKDKKSELDGKVNFGWLLVDDQAAATQVGGVIERDLHDLKCETSASAYSRFLEPMKDLFRGIKFILAPAIVAVMVVIVANAIGITVRERLKEMAILKVLGFGRARILFLVLGEGILLGFAGGLLGGGLTHALVNGAAGGLPLGDGRFYVSWQAWWWGPAIGAVTAAAGGLVPAWNACRVRVSEVFARVA